MNDVVMFDRPGAALAVHTWASTEPRAIVFYIHGTQSHAGWLFETGPALRVAGLTVIAVDRRGSGASEGTRGDITSYVTWCDDYAAALADTRTRYPKLPLLLVGQSFGGALAVELARRADSPHDALLLCSPLLVPRAANAPPDAPVDQPIAITTPDAWFCSRERYLAFMAADDRRLRALTPRFHAARVAMAAEYLAAEGALAAKPAMLVLPRHDRIVDLATTRATFTKLTASSGVIVELPTDDHYLEFSPAQRTLWQLEALYATSAGLR